MTSQRSPAFGRIDVDGEQELPVNGSCSVPEDFSLIPESRFIPCEVVR
jgi:hypothetical protein